MIVNKTKSDDNDLNKLIKIADLTTQNFTNVHWAYQQNETFFCMFNNPDGKTIWNWCPLNENNNITPKFYSDKFGRIRQRVGNEFSTDPYWIAYQKTGACQELSVLFNTTANKSGFVTRIVHADGIGHWWNEVKINDENEWKFFDLQRYGEVKYTNNTTSWFGNTSDYAERNPGYGLCNITQKGVYVVDLRQEFEEDITYTYDPRHICYHGSRNIETRKTDSPKPQFNIKNATLILPLTPPALNF